VPLPFRKEQSPNEGSQRLCLTVGGNTSGCLAALANIRSAGGGTALVKYFDIAGYCPIFAGTMLEPVHARHSDTLGARQAGTQEGRNSQRRRDDGDFAGRPAAGRFASQRTPVPSPSSSSLHPPSPLLSLPSAARVVMLAKP
jgi:hypothetical protein